MISKASQRGGGQQLATHLMNAIDNERVELLALRGAVARDLHGAFAEWEAQSTATKCRKYLYSMSINPDPQQRSLSRQEIADFIRRVENRLGLEHQPRAIVCHVKTGREHYHVAWSRIDTEKMKAVQLSHDRYKIRAAILEFTKEKQLEIPGRLKDKFNARAARETHAEKQQEERTGITKATRRRDITAAWNETATGQEFIAALEARGYTLAQGDRRGYVVIDRHGEIHSLARQIEGVKTKQLVARLIDFPAGNLPTAAKVREQARQKTALHLKDYFRVQAEDRRAALRQSHVKRRAALERIKKSLEDRHRAERTALLDVQRDRNTTLARERRDRELKGVAAFLAKVTGITKFSKRKQKEQDAQRTKAQRENIEQLTRRHERERRDLARHYRALGRVEKREAQSLETRLRRDIRTIQHEAVLEKRPHKQIEPEHIKSEFREKSAAPQHPTPANTNSLITEEFAKALKNRAAEKKGKREKDKDRSRSDRGPGHD